MAYDIDGISIGICYVSMFTTLTFKYKCSFVVSGHKWLIDVKDYILDNNKLMCVRSNTNDFECFLSLHVKGTSNECRIYFRARHDWILNGILPLHILKLDNSTNMKVSLMNIKTSSDIILTRPMWTKYLCYKEDMHLIISAGFIGDTDTYQVTETPYHYSNIPHQIPTTNNIYVDHYK